MKFDPKPHETKVRARSTTRTKALPAKGLTLTPFLPDAYRPYREMPSDVRRLAIISWYQSVASRLGAPSSWRVQKELKPSSIRKTRAGKWTQSGSWKGYEDGGDFPQSKRVSAADAKGPGLSRVLYAPLWRVMSAHPAEMFAVWQREVRPCLRPEARRQWELLNRAPTPERLRRWAAFANKYSLQDSLALVLGALLASVQARDANTSSFLVARLIDCIIKAQLFNGSLDHPMLTYDVLSRRILAHYFRKETIDAYDIRVAFRAMPVIARLQRAVELDPAQILYPSAVWERLEPYGHGGAQEFYLTANGVSLELERVEGPREGNSDLNGVHFMHTDPDRRGPMSHSIFFVGRLGNERRLI